MSFTEDGLPIAILGEVTGAGPALVLIDRTAGTTIGDMVNNGGIAAAFDGTTTQAGSATAGKVTSTTGYVGKTLVAAKVFGQAIVYGASDGGYAAGSDPQITINIRGKDGAAPSGPTDGTIIGTTGEFTDTATTNSKTIASTDLVNNWDHLFVQIISSGSLTLKCAELELWEWA